MTPEEEAAAQQGQGNGPPPPADGAGDQQAPPDAQGGGSDEAPSVQVAKAVYTSLKNLQGNLSAASNTYENPEAKSYFEGDFTTKCGEMMGEIKGLISKLGSNTGDDAPPTDEAEGGEMEEGGEKKKKPPEEADEEALKSFLAMGNNNDLKLLGYVAPLNALSKAKNLTPEQKLCLGGVLKSIRGLCDSAKNNAEETRKKALTDELASLQKSAAATTSSLAELQKTMNQMLGKK